VTVLLYGIRVFAGHLDAVEVAFSRRLSRLYAIPLTPTIVEDMQHPVSGAGVGEPSQVELWQEVMLSRFARLLLPLRKL